MRSCNFTCNTYNGASVVDYAIRSHGLCEKMEEVLIGEQLWGLNCDHKPIYLNFSWTKKEQLGRNSTRIPQSPSKGRILLTQKNYNTFQIALERLFKEIIPIHELCCLELINIIYRALAECKRAKNRKLKQIFFRSMLGLMKNAKRQGEL